MGKFADWARGRKRAGLTPELVAELRRDVQREAERYGCEGGLEIARRPSLTAEGGRVLRPGPSDPGVLIRVSRGAERRSRFVPGEPDRFDVRLVVRELAAKMGPRGPV